MPLVSWSNSVLFIYFEDKLTHRYYTRANSSRLMDHLEQENRELKEEIARLSALMESFLAAQSQSSPTPSTPSYRTVINEIVSSTVPAARAHFLPTAMPSGFPWGMPPSFMLDIPAPTFASMSASSPVLAVPPPVVHTVPRVDDTIYHSESSEGPDVHEKMDAMNDQFLELRKELKNLRGKDLFGKSAAELCLVPGVKIPVKFKTDNDQLLIHYFQDSLSGAALCCFRSGSVAGHVLEGQGNVQRVRPEVARVGSSDCASAGRERNDQDPFEDLELILLRADDC
ncbi:hypothetical protein KIW84_012858 [Lathyrus oleraceus]|uniref:Uncharacterized protein n=1 Tax=Pisum sativum TaxID=3888 RepID=A0A9D5BIS8_PEA|nr:hypothetical protein KIW84_012858 [Pisum sativum]